jgi:hypothetical protein
MAFPPHQFLPLGQFGEPQSQFVVVLIIALIGRRHSYRSLLQWPRLPFDLYSATCITGAYYAFASVRSVASST